MVDRAPGDNQHAKEQKPVPAAERVPGAEAALLPSRAFGGPGSTAALPGGIRRRPASVLALQRVVGNAVVSRLLREVEEEVAFASEDESAEPEAPVEESAPEPEPEPVPEPEPAPEPEVDTSVAGEPAPDESAPAEEAPLLEEATEGTAEGVIEDEGTTEAKPTDADGGETIDDEGVDEADTADADGGEQIDDEGVDEEDDAGPSLGLPSFLSGGLIVDDDTEEPEEGQLTKSAFLGQLRAAVTPRATEIVAQAGDSVDAGAGIDFWFGKFGGQSGSAMERAINVFAPSTIGADSAAEMIPVLADRVTGPIQTWLSTGEVVGVPDIPGLGTPLFDPGVFFKAAADAAPSSADPLVLRARLGPGEPLAGNTGAAIGGVFGQDFSDVRIHRDGMADTLASGLSARAFTVGSHIAFAAGEHQPGTPVGDALIAHELAHVAQQHQGAAAGVQTRGDGDESALEADADRAAVSAVVALRGGKDRLATWAKTIGPNLRSGLRLLRCNRSNEPPKPDPGPVPTPEQVTAHAAAMNQLLGDPVANVAAIKAKLAEMGPYGGHILLKVLMLRNRPQMGAIAGTPPGPEIIRGLIESLRTGDYAAFSAQLRPNGEDPGNIVERDSGRILADDLERLLNQMNQPAPAGDKDTQAELARVNAAIAADARMSDYKAAGLIFPISLYQPGTERDAGLYYDPTLITEGMTSPIYLSKGDRRPIVISIRIGRKALKEESGAERSDAFVRSTLNHEFVHFKQYLDFRNKNLDSDERVDQLRVDDVAEDKGEAGPSADVEAITAQLVNDIATLGDPDVRGLLRYMSEKWNFAFPSFRDRAIVAMKDQGHPLGAKDGVQMKRMLGLIKGMGLHAGKKRKKGEPPGKDLASLYQALGGT